MDLSIIIVSFNVKKLLRECLKSLPALVEVVVVDNASVDGSARMVAKEFPKCKLIKNKENLGFAKATNQGIKEVKRKDILLLNPDTVVKPGALKKLVNFAQTHPLVGVLGGKLLDPDGKTQGSCYYLPRIKSVLQGKSTEKYAPRGQDPVEVEAVTGAVFFIPNQVIKKVGLFDERYFMYFEDLDYCRRVREAGLKVYYLPQAEFIHYHGASGKTIPEKTHQWLVESSKRYHGRIKYWLLTLILLIKQKWSKIFRKR